MSPRKLTVALTALSCVGLLGCSSGGKDAAAPALPPVSATDSASATTSAPESPSVAPGDSPTAAPAPGVTTPGAAPAPANPPAATPPAANPPAPSPTAAAPKPPAAAPTAVLPSLSNDPAKAVAQSGPKGQAYLTAIHNGGIPGNTAVDGLYILFAEATCKAKAQGDTRDSILTQFDSLGQTLAPNTSLNARQISELFVSSAEKTFC